MFKKDLAVAISVTYSEAELEENCEGISGPES
jgi:hypothetical protein